MSNPKAKEWIEGRKNIWITLKERVKKEVPTAWFHCASLGEFEQARPVLEKFRVLYPHYQIILTFFSPSGYQICKNYDKADVVSYLPTDTYAHAQKFVEIIQPTLVFWTKYEFWYHHLAQIHQQNIPLILFSAKFRKNQHFFKFYGGFHKKILTFFTQIFTQDEESEKLLQNIGVPSKVAYDTRFDRVLAIVEQNNTLEKVKLFKDNTPVLVIGSLWKEDWQILLPFIQRFEPELKLIIAPHETTPHYISMLLEDLKENTLLFSDLEKTSQPQFYKNLIIDSVGHLSSLYRYADFTFIGGGFKQGLHNILEPAAFGMPIFFGNQHYKMFREAHELMGLGSAFAIGNAQELEKIFTDLYNNCTQTKKLGEMARHYVRVRAGGTDTILTALKENIIIR